MSITSSDNEQTSKDEFNACAIDIACALKEMTDGYATSAEDLRNEYPSASDEVILRIVDTLHPTRLDWMDDARQSVSELLEYVPPSLHSKIVDDALDLAFKRLKQIGYLQISGDYIKKMEEDANEVGKDRFPEHYDASQIAERHAQTAIEDLSAMKRKISKAKKTLSLKP